MSLSKRILFLLFFFSPIAAFTQLDSSAIPEQNYNLHLMDLLRFDAPGLKISYETRIKENTLMGIEGGIISDFNASIYRLDLSEKGIIGGHLGLYYMFNFPVSSLDNNQVGIRINYAFKERKIKDWIFRDFGSYRQKLNYRQTNNNLALYLRIASTRRHPNGISYTLGINPGVMYQNVTTNLPEGASMDNNGTLFSGGVYNSIKDEGHYFIPHLYVELNIGYTFQSK